MSFNKTGDASMIGKPIDPKDSKSTKSPKESEKKAPKGKK
jgi:hypothetical protein